MDYIKGRLLAFTGLAGSGKSTAARYFTENGAVLIRFAEPFKGMLKAVGLTDEQIDGSLKAVPDPIFCGQTPRYLMQTLGTEWGRRLVGEELWINLWRRKVISCFSGEWFGFGVVCDDCRFQNEVDAIHELGGIVVKIARAGVEQGNHPSEISVQSLVPDFAISNDGSIEALHTLMGGLL